VVIAKQKPIEKHGLLSGVDSKRPSIAGEPINGLGLSIVNKANLHLGLAFYAELIVLFMLQSLIGFVTY